MGKNNAQEVQVGESLLKGTVNLFSCDSQKLYLISTFTETLFLVCLNLSQHHISLTTFHIVSSACTWYSIKNTCLSKIYYAE